MSRSDSSTSSSSSSPCAAPVRAGRRGRAPGRAARVNGSRQRPHCRPSRAAQAAPDVDGLVVAALDPGALEPCPPARSKLSSPSRWTCARRRGRRRYPCPPGGIWDDVDRRASAWALKRSILRIRPDLSRTWPAGGQRSAEERACRRRAGQPRSSRPGSGPRSAKVERTPRSRPGRHPRAPHTAGGRSRGCGRWRRPTGRSRGRR